MKLRQQPEDFIVEEIPDFRPSPKGKYFVYEVTKTSIATLDVCDILCKALRLSGRDVSASGLKDKHAIATQLISLPKPLPASFANQAFTTRFIGKSEKPMSVSNIKGNRFTITARSLQELELEGLVANIAELTQFGVPNYYDSQRFGAGGAKGDFPGKAVLRGDFEEAMRLHLAVPRRKQMMKDKRIRRDAAKHWGDWETLIRKLPRCRERSIIAYLVDHPDDFRGAIERSDSKVFTLYLAAYQSWIFNRTLTQRIEAALPAEALVSVASKGGQMRFWKELSEAQLGEFQEELLPLPSHASQASEFSPATWAALEHALEEESLSLPDLMVKRLDSIRLRDAKRPMLLQPANLKVEGPVEDELNKGRLKVVASFELPRGSFATIILKRLGMKRHQAPQGVPKQESQGEG